MVGKGSPKINMIASGSPKLRRLLAATSAIKKKPSPKCIGAKKSGGSPRAKQRADWNPTLEKSLVEILHEYKDSGYRGDNGWNSEGWNKMVKEFHLRNKYVSYTKAQIQEKEGQLKRDYKMLKEARKQSGSNWNHDRNMVEGPPAMWDNLIVTFPKIKKFRNSKATFPLFDALGELYDGHLAEGTYNFTSIDEAQEEEPLHQIHDLEAPSRHEAEIHEVLDEEDGDVAAERDEDLDEIHEVTIVERSGPRRPTTSRNIQGKEEKRPKRGARIEDMMERFLNTRQEEAALLKKKAEEEAALLKKKAEEEASQLAREKEAAESNDFSIKRCISVLNTVELTKEEKGKAIAVFIRSKENKEAFICGCESDVESTLIWLRKEMV